MLPRIIIGNEVYRQATMPYDSPHPSLIQETEDEFGTLHVIPMADFSGDITSDITRLSSSHEDMTRWLYGALGSDESITDEVGEIVYSGADVQDVLRALDEYEEDPAESGMEIGPGAHVAPGWRLGSPEPEPVFDYNVDELDKLVTTALADEAIEGGDMFVTVDIRPADEIQGDLGSVEGVINNASLITTVAGEYIVEAEGADVLVAFNANSRDVDKLVPAFLEE
jgi:hypothetical protein